ncbi:MAG: rod shape-determining protein MreC [Candidatus Brocadiia bacterium]
MWKLLLRAWERLRLLIALVVVSAFLFLMPARFTAPARVVFEEAAGPAQTALYQGSGHALATTGTLTEMFLEQDRERALSREVVRLRSENAMLAEQLRRRQAALSSAEALEVKRFPVRAVRAPVAAYDATAARHSVSVRAGTRDGVGEGMAVTSMGALVGVVQRAGPSQCRVRLITDPQSVVPCRMARTRDLCLLTGTGGRTCLADWLERGAFVEPGDELVTTALEVEPAPGLRVPAGLPAGTVQKVEPDRMRPLFLRVQVQPGVNLRRLEAVEVLVPVGG